MAGLMGTLWGTEAEENMEYDEDFLQPGVEDDDVEEEVKTTESDKELLDRLKMAFLLATKEDRQMRRDQFRQALATMGKVFTKDEADQYFHKAYLYQTDEKTIRASTERDERGLVRQSIVSSRSLAVIGTGGYLHLDGFQKYYMKFLTRTVDPLEAEAHFRAIVEGAAQRAIHARHGDDVKIDDDAPFEVADLTRAEAELAKMADSKHLPITELFVYARDLRRVLVTYAEKLSDEEADQLIRECRPQPKKKAGDGGLDRVYFSQYLTMLRDETL